MAKRMCKSQKNRVIAGVCGGISEYFNIDATIVRLAVVILCCIKGSGVLVYILACLIMPTDNDFASDYEDVENLKSAKVDFESEGSTKDSENNSNKKFHTDQEFNEFFNKKKK